MYKNLFRSTHTVSFLGWFFSWLKSDEHHTERFKVGNALISATPFLFLLHLFFKTHYEPGIFIDSSVHLGYETTFLTFTGIVVLPFVFFSRISLMNLGEISEVLALWGRALVFGAGNILLASTYLMKRKLKKESFRKKQVAVTAICIIVAFFSPDLRTFYFGYVLWLAALISLLAGLLLLNGRQEEDL